MKSKLIVNIFKNTNFIIFILFGILSYLLFYNLGEYDQPTANLWINRSYKFFYEVKTKNFDQTYLFYHPGVTLMWLVGPVVYYFPKYTMYLYNQTIDPFDAKVFYEFNKLALIPIVTTVFATIILNLFIIKKLFSKNIALIFLLLVISEPFFIGNARSIHVDTLQTVFIFTTFLTSLYYLQSKNKLYLLLSGLFLGLSILTKITTVIIVPYLGLLYLTNYLSFKQINKSILKTTLNFLAIILICSTLFFALWPIMWTQPIQTLQKIYQDGIAESGFEHNLGYNYIYFTSISNDSIITKVIHYPLQFIFRTNGFLIILSLISLTYLLKLKNNIFIKKNKILILCALFPLYYLVLMSTSGKMIFRYLLIIYPFFHLFLALSINKLLKTRFRIIIIALLLFAIIDSSLSSTNSLTYYNTIVGGISSSKSTIYTDQAGAGLYNIADDLNKVENIGNQSVAVFDNNSFSGFFAGDTLKLKNHNYTNNKVNTDFVIIGVQNDNKYFDTNRKDYKLIKQYKYRGQTHWDLYKKVTN